MNLKVYTLVQYLIHMWCIEPKWLHSEAYQYRLTNSIVRKGIIECCSPGFNWSRDPFIYLFIYIFSAGKTWNRDSINYILLYIYSSKREKWAGCFIVLHSQAQFWMQQVWTAGVTQQSKQWQRDNTVTLLDFCCY